MSAESFANEQKLAEQNTWRESVKDHSYVFVEAGGKGIPGKLDFSLLNQVTLPEDALFIGIDKEKMMLDGIPKKQIAAVAMMQADLTRPEFLNDESLDDSVDCFVAFNVFSILRHPEGRAPDVNVVQKITALLKPGGQALIGEWITPYNEVTLSKVLSVEQRLQVEVYHRHRDIRDALAPFNFSKWAIERIVSECKYCEFRGDKPFLFVITKKKE